MSTVLLSAKEVHDLKRMCNDPFLELGMTLRPKHLECFKQKIATSYMRIIILFEEHIDADKWNTMHEKRIRYGGHLATITLTTLVGMLSKNYTTTVATGSGLAILKDEVQAKIWYPKMHKGWVLTRRFTFRYEQFPHQNFYMMWNDIIKDETGKEIERHEHGQCHSRVGGLFGLPEKLVRDLMTKEPKFQTLRFK